MKCDGDRGRYHIPCWTLKLGGDPKWFFDLKFRAFADNVSSTISDVHTPYYIAGTSKASLLSFGDQLFGVFLNRDDNGISNCIHRCYKQMVRYRADPKVRIQIRFSPKMLPAMITRKHSSGFSVVSASRLGMRMHCNHFLVALMTDLMLTEISIPMERGTTPIDIASKWREIVFVPDVTVQIAVAIEGLSTMFALSYL